MARRKRIKERGRGLKPVAKIFSRDLVIKLGILGDKAQARHKGSEEGETVAEIMRKHEFGLGVPERSFIRAFIDENRDMIQKDVRAVLKKAALSNGSFTVEHGLKLLGTKYEGLIKGRISDGIPPPNSDATIARKGSSKPLIDTGQGRAAISHEVGPKS